MGPAQVEVRRDEHFKKEKRIFFKNNMFLLWNIIWRIFLIVYVSCIRLLKPETDCDRGLCLFITDLNFVNVFSIMIIVIYSVQNLLRKLAKHLSYEYKEHRAMFILQGLVIIIGLIAGCAFSLLLGSYFDEESSKDQSALSRWFHYISAGGPCFVICFIWKPDCLFTRFNAYPE